MAPTKWNRTPRDPADSWSMAVTSLMSRMRFAAHQNGLREEQYVIRAKRNADGKVVVAIIVESTASGFGDPEPVKG